MLRVFLCVLAVAACTGIAYLFTRKHKQRMLFFYNLDLFNERLVNEVSYTRVPLPAFIEKYEFGGDFKKMLQEKRASDFGTENYGFSYLTPDERKFLSDYFLLVGRSDAASQRTYLSAVREEIAGRRRSAEEIYKKYFSLYMKLGFLAGLVLAVLIV